MNGVKLSVKVTGDRTQVAILTETITADVKEERGYFLDPVQCVDIANLMLKCAEECGVTVKMETAGISDEKRLRLYKRTEHVIRSLSGRKLNVMAPQVVDTILAEVL